jgi:hypothetical protein
MFSQIMNSFIASREKGGPQSGEISSERAAASSQERLRPQNTTIRTGKNPQNQTQRNQQRNQQGKRISKR